MSEYSSLLPRQAPGSHNTHVHDAPMRPQRSSTGHGHGHGRGHGHGHESDEDSVGNAGAGFEYPYQGSSGCDCCSSFFNLCRPSKNKGPKASMRVEPKTFFANERTFLSWLNMSLTISVLALGLVGFADDFGMQLAGIILLSTGVLFSLYSYYIFVKRAQKIRAREEGPYDDVVGPGVLLFVVNGAIVASLLAAVVFGGQSQV